MLRIPSTVNISAVWNTTAGHNSLPATPGTGIGNYFPPLSPQNVFDGDWATSFASYGFGYASIPTATGGLNTGVYLTIPGDPFVLNAFRIVTTGSVEVTRDPLKLTIEGSNLIGSALTLGSSWILIYNGTTGLDINPGRTKPGICQTINNNTSTFSSYRFLFTERRAGDIYCIDYKEIELYSF